MSTETSTKRKHGARVFYATMNPVRCVPDNSVMMGFSFLMHWITNFGLNVT